MNDDTDGIGVCRPPATVVVPNLNNARFLRSTLDSIAAQSVRDLDVVIVDGGSTDGSVEIIRAWSEDNRAHWISEPDDGQAQAINKGFRMARGEIVAWLNSDDVYPPGAIKRAIHAFADDRSLDVLWGFCLYVDCDGRPIRIGNPMVCHDLAELRGRRNFVMQPGSWFRRSLFERFGYLDESFRYALDYEFFLRLAGSVKARMVPEIMAHFRLHAASKTVGQSHLSLPEQWRAHRAHGGRILSPFALDVARNVVLAPAMAAVARPLRAILWRILGLEPGTRVRP